MQVRQQVATGSVMEIYMHLPRVDLNEDEERAGFGNEAIAVSAFATSDAGDPALAISSVHGLDANNVPQSDDAIANN